MSSPWEAGFWGPVDASPSLAATASLGDGPGSRVASTETPGIKPGDVYFR